MALRATFIIVGCLVVFVLMGATRGESATYYWSSFEADSAIQSSDWGDARGVYYVTCRGTGAFKKQYGTFSFARFRCELENRNVDRIGFVSIVTTGPEAWKPLNFIKPRC